MCFTENKLLQVDSFSPYSKCLNCRYCRQNFESHSVDFLFIKYRCLEFKCLSSMQLPNPQPWILWLFPNYTDKQSIVIFSLKIIKYALLLFSVSSIAVFIFSRDNSEGNIGSHCGLVHQSAADKIFLFTVCSVLAFL